MTNEQQKPVAPTSNPAAAPQQKPQHNPQQNQGDSKPGIDKSGTQPQQK